MKRSSLKFLLLAGVFAIIQACTVQKRIYRPGYYITWNHSADKSSHHDSQEIVRTETVTDEETTEGKGAVAPEEVPVNSGENELREESYAGNTAETPYNATGESEAEASTESHEQAKSDTPGQETHTAVPEKNSKSEQTLFQDNDHARYWSSDQKILAIILLLLITIALLILLGYLISIALAGDITVESGFLAITLILGFIGVIVLFFVILSAFLLRPSSSQVERREARLKQQEEQEAKQQAQEEKRLEKLTPEERQAEQLRKEEAAQKNGRNNIRIAIFMGIAVSILTAIITWNLAK